MYFRFFRLLGFVILIFAVLVFVAWLTSSDPKFNHATFEIEPFEASIAEPIVAITLAQYINEAGNTVTLLVEKYENDEIIGVDLAEFGAPYLSDPFAVLASIDRAQLQKALPKHFERQSVAVARLLPTGPSGTQHLGIGTNFPEHAEEANSSSVFNFPKFGQATPARTSVVSPKVSMLDYEVELCLRFDRPIATLADFDAAIKGVFLCADFTDRIVLLKLADPDNLDSGYGFSDAKSGKGFFPTGPFLVIPTDWSSFIANTRMMTLINNEPRQDARGREMILDFRALTEKVLTDMVNPRFYYQGNFFKLAPDSRIEKDMALMSGTSEGVIFTTPQRHDYIEILLGYLLKGGPLSGDTLMDFAIPAFIENERASGHFLKPGDNVTYRASHLGEIVVDVTP